LLCPFRRLPSAPEVPQVRRAGPALGILTADCRLHLRAVRVGGLVGPYRSPRQTCHRRQGKKELVHRSVSYLYYRRSSFETVEAAGDGRLGTPSSPR
jgi:hypothetical protein